MDFVVHGIVKEDYHWPQTHTDATRRSPFAGPSSFAQGASRYAEATQDKMEDETAGHACRVEEVICRQHVVAGMSA